MWCAVVVAGKVPDRERKKRRRVDNGLEGRVTFLLLMKGDDPVAVDEVKRENSCRGAKEREKR